jgi:predicted DsbA family dithiol-disulfide isomerase
MRACIASGAMNSTIDADIDRTKEAGVESTPTFLIGGVMIKGAQPLAVFQQTIDGALARAAATAPKP